MTLHDHLSRHFTMLRSLSDLLVCCRVDLLALLLLVCVHFNQFTVLIGGLCALCSA